MSNSDDSWDFKVDPKAKPSEKTQKTVAMPRLQKREDLLEDDTTGLGVTEIRPEKRKSRKQLAKEYEREEDKIIEAHPDELYGSFYRRLMAFCFDLMTVTITFVIASIYFPAAFIEFESIVMAILGISTAHFEIYLLTSILAVYIPFVVAPHMIFGASLGKKMMNIKVFGKERKQLGFLQGAIRELLLKPLSLVSLIGTLICFFSKKRKMLHDHIIASEVHRE